MTHDVDAEEPNHAFLEQMNERWLQTPKSKDDAARAELRRACELLREPRADDLETRKEQQARADKLLKQRDALAALHAPGKRDKMLLRDLGQALRLVEDRFVHEWKRRLP